MKSTGAIHRAIPCTLRGKAVAYMLIGNDGNGSPEFTKPDMVEEVQS